MCRKNMQLDVYGDEACLKWLASALARNHAGFSNVQSL
jgi:hypothetical protein